MSVQFGHPSQSPACMANFAKTLDHDECVLIVLGFSKEFSEALLRRTEKLHLVVVDPTIDPAKVQGGSNFQIFGDLWTLGRDFPFILSRRYGLRLEALPGARTLWPDLWQGLIDFGIKQKQNMNSDIVTACRFAYEWQRNTLLNMRHLKTAGRIKDWFGALEGQPGILIASGPSLDDNLDALRETDAFKLAVGSAAPRLKDEGIKPDAVIAFDGGIANWICHFEGLELDCPLIFDPIVYHQIPTAWSGPRIVMQIWPFHYFSQTVGELGLVEVGPSVANTGFDLLLKMGCDPIILVGQDLAYRGEQIHAKGTHRTKLAETLKTSNYDPHLVPAVNGGQLASNVVFKTFLNTFEARIAAAKMGRPVNVINASFGAKIPGTVDHRLSEIGLQRGGKARGLQSTPPASVTPLADRLQLAKNAGLDLFRRAEAKQFPGDLLQPALEPLSFVLQPVWNNARCERDKEWAVAELRAGLRFALPLLEETIYELRKAA